jgi:hypothetical protein
MAYISLADAKAYLGIAGTDDDALLTGMLAGAQQLVERYCDRVFEAATDGMRAFDCVHPVVIGSDLHLDADLCSITQIVNGDDVVVSPDDYLLKPQEPPWQLIRLKWSTDKAWVWVADPWAAITVTGKWAYSETPPVAIVHATKEIVGWLYRSYDRQAVADDQGQTAAAVRELPATARTLLDPFRRH